MTDIIKLRVTWGIITTMLMSAGTIGGLIFEVRSNSAKIAVIDRKLADTSIHCQKIDLIEFQLRYLTPKPAQPSKGG